VAASVTAEQESNATPRAHLRVVAPESEIIPLAPAPNTMEMPAQALAEAQNASDKLQQLREAKLIEARQEEEARQYKQAAGQSLSQRLAQAHPAIAGSHEAVKSAPLSEAAPAIPLVAPTQLKNPPVPIRPQPTTDNKPKTERVGQPLNPTSAKREVEAQNRSALAVRIGAAMLGLSLLAGGFYAYRRQVFSGNLIGAARDLLSPEEQSARLLQAGRADLQEGKVEEATEKLERAIALTPNEPLSHEELANAYTQRGRTEEALRTLDGLLKLAPEHLDARLKLADLQRRKGNLHEARAQYQKIISLSHETSQAALALAAIEAIDLTLNANALAANNDTARLRRNVAPKRVGPVLPATTMARLPITLIGTNPALRAPAANPFDWSSRRAIEAPDPHIVAAMHKKLGIRYNNIREFGPALEELQKAVRLTPDDKDLYYFIGSAYRGLNQPLKAFDNYKRCDGGDYAAVAQSGAKQLEKSARKEYQQQQAQKEKNAPQTEAQKENQRNNSLQDLHTPIIAPLSGRNAFKNTPE
jgi:tetratricopeptide (TPR) repeat protein